jgi:adenylate kinase family enzyme
MSGAVPTPFPYRRVNVVGTSCSGKTTFAAALANTLGIPHVELDALHWEPNWKEASSEAMRERVAAAVAGDSWVVDGNYSVSRDLVWARADAVIWLDYPLRTILRRYWIRTRRRLLSREEIWPGTGNRERLGNHLVGREGLLWWILSTYHRRRREYPILMDQHPELAVIHLQSAADADAWLAGRRA